MNRWQVSCAGHESASPWCCGWGSVAGSLQYRGGVSDGHRDLGTSTHRPIKCSHMIERYAHVIQFKIHPLLLKWAIYRHYSAHIDLYCFLIDIYMYRSKFKFTFYSDSEWNTGEYKTSSRISFTHYQATLFSLIL